MIRGIGNDLMRMMMRRRMRRRRRRRRRAQKDCSFGGFV
jgi:hypothetical protein